MAHTPTVHIVFWGLWSLHAGHSLRQAEWVQRRGPLQLQCATKGGKGFTRIQDGRNSTSCHARAGSWELCNEGLASACLGRQV
jgi:hypothetical protein